MNNLLLVRLIIPQGTCIIVLFAQKRVKLISRRQQFFYNTNIDIFSKFFKKSLDYTRPE